MVQYFIFYLIENWSSIHNYISKPSIPGIITDISDGERFKQFRQEVELVDKCAEYIGLILNADGVPLFKSSGMILYFKHLLMTCKC